MSSAASPVASRLGALFARNDPRLRLKTAMTERRPVTATSHEPVPEQAPAQRSKTKPDAGVALSVTCPPPEKAVQQLSPQSITPSPLVTRPSPEYDTVSACVAGIGADPPSNCACSCVPSSAVVSHVRELPTHAPPQLAR